MKTQIPVEIVSNPNPSESDLAIIAEHVANSNISCRWKDSSRKKREPKHLPRIAAFDEAISHYKEIIANEDDGYSDADVETAKFEIANSILILFGLPLSLQENPKSKETKTGYVYAMQDKRNGAIKIGWSSEPEKRERTLQSQVPETELLAYWECPASVEKLLHARFQSARLRGEWFDIGFEEVKEFFDGSIGQSVGKTEVMP